MIDGDETICHIVQAIKQFCFGFETMNDTSDLFNDGSPARVFYLNSIYNYIAVFYLLDKGNDPMGGALYKLLKPFGWEDTLHEINLLLNASLGKTTFGEIIKTFRNKAIVHFENRDKGLDSIYEKINMEEPENQILLQKIMTNVYLKTRQLAIVLIKKSNFKLKDFGIVEI